VRVPTGGSSATSGCAPAQCKRALIALVCGLFCCAKAAAQVSCTQLVAVRARHTTREFTHADQNPPPCQHAAQQVAHLGMGAHPTCKAALAQHPHLLPASQPWPLQPFPMGPLPRLPPPPPSLPPRGLLLWAQLRLPRPSLSSNKGRSKL